jgi:hypothetical protein
MTLRFKLTPISHAKAARRCRLLRPTLYSIWKLSVALCALSRTGVISITRASVRPRYKRLTRCESQSLMCILADLVDS